MKSFLASAIVAIAFAQEEEAAAEPVRDASYAAASVAYAASTADTCDADVEGVVGELSSRERDQDVKDAHAANTASESELCTCFANANAGEDETAKATQIDACACAAGEIESCTGASAIATGAALFAIAALLQ